MLSDIIFESINAKYAYGQYGEFKVIIMKDNGYINATKLCNERGKMLKHWLENESSKELIKEAETSILASAGIPADARSVIIITGTRKPELRGSYVNPLLIPHIASWYPLVLLLNLDQQFNFSNFLDEFQHINATNGGQNTGLNSGVITAFAWQSGYLFYVADLSRRLSPEDKVPKSILVRGINNTNVTMDYICFRCIRKGMYCKNC